MKKFLIMLTVVAMASFLMVGCFVTPPADVAVTGVTLDKATLALVAGGATGTLVATVAPADATDPRINWASSDKAVATVALGVVTPLTAGLAVITVTTVDGSFEDTCVVTVTAEEEPVLPPSVAPVIDLIATVGAPEVPLIDLYTSGTQYMNKADVTSGILVYGYALKYSEVNVYVDDEIVGTSTAYGGDEEFTVFVAKANLGADGAKTLYATATEMGLAESANSTEYAFTLDTVAPEMTGVTAEVVTSWDGTVAVTFSEELDGDTAEDTNDWTVVNITAGPLNPLPILSVELISSKVVEIEFGFLTGPVVGDLIRVAYADVASTPVTDLAGNPAVESDEWCLLGL